MLSEGIFQAVVIGQTWTRSQSQSIGLQITVKITEGLSDGEEITGCIWFTDNSMRMARAQLKSLGVDVDTVPLKSVSVKDAKCRVKIKNEEYKGQSQLKIGFFLPFEETPPEAELDAIEKALRGVASKPKPAKASAKPVAAKPTPPAASGLPPAPPVSTEPLPFDEAIGKAWVDAGMGKEEFLKLLKEKCPDGYSPTKDAATARAIIAEAAQENTLPL